MHQFYNILAGALGEDVGEKCTKHNAENKRHQQCKMWDKNRSE
jgi:hypothetical protein